MVDFRKVEARDVVAENVTVRLLRGNDDNVLGEVTSVGTGQGGGEEASTAGDDPPIEFALRIARELARSKGHEHIDIVDPHALWEATWGDLRR